MKLLSKIILVCSLINNALGEIVKKIDILETTEFDETIIMFSDINLNENVDNNELNLILKNLYDSNFFENIIIDLTKNTLTITLLNFQSLRT